jgi:hypothetical protein
LQTLWGPLLRRNGTLMRSRGYVGEDLTQEATAYRDIDDRLAEDVAFMRACLAG